MALEAGRRQPDLAQWSGDIRPHEEALDIEVEEATSRRGRPVGGVGADPLPGKTGHVA